jgi:putative membrane protein
MRNLLVHVVITALLLALVDYFLDGITIDGFFYALLAAIVLGIVNTIVRPVLVIVTLPITILTLGLFLFVLNALMLELAAAIVPGFEIASFSSALVGGFLLALFNLAASALLHPKRQS